MCVFVIILAESVHRHMQHYEVEYLQFAFRWMNNLLMRELPLRCTIRLWDTYQVLTHTRIHRTKPVLLCFLLSHFYLALCDISEKGVFSDNDIYDCLKSGAFVIPAVISSPAQWYDAT